jgi:peroxiredoxin
MAWSFPAAHRRRMALETRDDEPRRGRLFPEFRLQAVDGALIAGTDYRDRRNLVIVLAGTGEDRAALELGRSLGARFPELQAEDAQVLFIVANRPAEVQTLGTAAPLPFPMLVDEGGRLHRQVGATDAEGRPTLAVCVTDRFREVYDVSWPARGEPVPTPDSILASLRYLNGLCPECFPPEWPAD